MNNKVFILFLACNSTLIYAQSDHSTSSHANNEATTLNDVTVIGQKIDRSLQETVAGTSILDETLTQDTAAVNLSDVLDYASNVNMANTGNYNSFVIRGINAKGVDGGGTELGSVFLNGAYLPVSAFHGALALWDIEQVVINKGPQSTTQGRNSLAGTIHLQNKRPEFDNSGSVRMGLGSDGWKNTAIMLNRQASEDFAIRLSAQHNRKDGQITNIYLNDDAHDYTKNTSVNLQLLYEPSDETSALLTVGHIDDSQGERMTCTENNSTAVYPCMRGDLKANQAIKPRHNVETNYQTLEFKQNLNTHWTFKSITSRTGVDDADYGDWTRYNPESPYYPTANGQPLPANETYNGWERESLSQEFRFNFENNRLRSSSGIYWARNTTERFRDGNVPYDFSSFLSALDPSGALALEGGKEYLQLKVAEDGGEYETNTFAIFNDTDFDVTERLTINAGLRYDNEKVSVNSLLQTSRADDLSTFDQNLPNSVQYTAAQTSLANAACALSAQLCGASFTQIISALNQQQLPDLNNIVDAYLASTINNGYNKPVSKRTQTFLPKLGFSYDLSDNVTVGYLYSRGYRSGGAGVNTGTGQPFEYKPEYLDNHEISLKSNWMNGRLSANTSLYYARWKDQQVGVLGNENPYDQRTANAGKSELYGLELDTYYTHDSGLYGFGNLAFTHTQYKEFDNNGVSYAGNEFAYVPRASANIGIGYRTGKGWNANMTTKLTKGSYQNANNKRKSPGYGITNVRLGYEGQSWQVNAFVNNIFNKKVEERYWQFSTSAFASASVYLPERSYGVTFQYDF